MLLLTNSPFAQMLVRIFGCRNSWGNEFKYMSRINGDIPLVHLPGVQGEKEYVECTTKGIWAA